MEVYLGDWVECTTHHYVGRVYAKHNTFQDTNENDRWFEGQTVPLELSDKEKPWYSVLTLNGGSVLISERCIKIKTEVPYDGLNNIWASFYFRD